MGSVSTLHHDNVCQSSTILRPHYKVMHKCMHWKDNTCPIPLSLPRGRRSRGLVPTLWKRRLRPTHLSEWGGHISFYFFYFFFERKSLLLHCHISFYYCQVCAHCQIELLLAWHASSKSPKMVLVWVSGEPIWSIPHVNPPSPSESDPVIYNIFMHSWAGLTLN